MDGVRWRVAAISVVWGWERRCLDRDFVTPFFLISIVELRMGDWGYGVWAYLGRR